MKKKSVKILFPTLLICAISVIGSCTKEIEPNRCECSNSIKFHLENDEDIMKLMDTQTGFEYNKETGEFTSQHYTEDDCSKDGEIISQSNAATVYSRCRIIN